MQNFFDQFDGPQGVQIKPADPTQRFKEPSAAADLTGKTLDNEATRLRIQMLQEEAAREREKAAREAAVNKDLDARNSKLSTLQALAEQLVRVEKLYNESFRGGVPNFIAGRLQPADAEALDRAASGLLDAGQSVFRVPGSGDQSDRELQFKLDAYKPSATGTDKGNTESFNYLRSRINAELKGMGAEPIDFDALIAPEAPPQSSILNPAAGRDATRSETAALESGQRFAYDEAGQPIGILDAQGNWVSGYGEIVGGNQQERDDAARDSIMGGIDAFGRGLVDWPTLGNANKLSAAINSVPALLRGEGFGDAYQRNIDIENRKDAADERVNFWPRFGGQATGVLASGIAAGRSFPKLFGGGELPAFSARGMAMDAGAGAVYEGSKAIDRGEDILPAMGTGATFATMGGVGGRGAANIGGRTLSGVTNPDVQRLRAAGVPMTMPQMVGGSSAGILPFGAKAGEVIKGFEDVAEGLGPLGAGVRQARIEGVEGMNRAAFREGGFPVNEIAEQGIDQARGIRSQAYADALDGNGVVADLPFVRNANDIAKQSDQIKGMEGMFRDTLMDRVGSQFDKSSRAMTGRGLQAAIRGLRADAKTATNSSNYMRSDQFSDAAKRMEDELLSLADRQNPGMAKGYKDANRLNLNLGILKDAVRAGKNTEGRFTAAQLGAASDRAAEKFGGKGGTTQRPFYDLQRAAQNVLPNKIPDSGTTGRAASAALPYLVAGGTQTGLVPGLETGSAEANILTALALLTSKGGRKLSETALLSRPAKVRNAGKAIRKRAGLFGAAGAPAAILISE